MVTPSQGIYNFIDFDWITWICPECHCVNEKRVYITSDYYLIIKLDEDGEKLYQLKYTNGKLIKSFDEFEISLLKDLFSQILKGG